MKNIFFPTTIVDGFFDDPDSIRKFALHQEYYQNDGFPGGRTRRMDELNPTLYHTVNKKILDLFFSTTNNISCKTTMYCQLVDHRYGSGWVHIDNKTFITGIVYLSKNENEKPIGTSLFIKKDSFIDPVNDPKNVNVRRQAFLTQQDFKNSRNLHNSHYEEVINVKGLYNRLLMFDGHFYHAAQEFIGTDTESARLTLIAFFDHINFGEGEIFPIQRMQRNALTQL